MLDFLLSRRVLIAAAIRFVLYEFTNFAKFSESLPYTKSLHYDYERLEDAFHIMDKGQDPYEFRMIFHNPLEVVFFKALNIDKHLVLVFLILIDVLNAYLIAQPSMTPDRFEGEMKKKDRLAWATWFLFNPFSIAACIRLSTNNLEIFIPLLTVFITRKFGLVAGGALFGYCLYHNLQSIIILAVLLLFVYENTEDRRHVSKIKGVQLLGATVGSYAGLVLISSAITGNMVFLEKSVGEIIFPDYIAPNPHFAWFLQLSTFNRFKDFYCLVLAIAQLSFVAPLHALFHKYHRYQKFADGYLAYFSGIVLAFMYFFSLRSTFYDLWMIIVLIYTQYELVSNIKLLIVMNFVMLLLVAFSTYNTYIWMNSNAAEASFVFFYQLIAGALFTIFIAENLTTLQLQTNDHQEELKLKAKPVS